MTTVIRAAIYARRSKEQKGLSKAETSVELQIELSREFAAAQGWLVADAHVYTDDGFSGAEFRRRPAYQELMAAMKPKPPFSVLIVSEQKSLGREAYETQYAIKQLSQAGVEVWSYMERACLTPRNALDKAMRGMKSYGDEAHREDTSRRNYDKSRKQFERGQVPGGRVFGYRNVDVFSGFDDHGRPVKSHVVREIDLTEAAVVLRIFELYDAGFGLKAIAKQLTVEGAAKPKPMNRKDGLTSPGWAPSTVRAVLGREDYHGVLIWDRTQKRHVTWGEKHGKALGKPEAQWLRRTDEQLRIVPEDLWQRVAARRAETEGRTLRFESGRISGRPPKHATKNLLAGLATCGVCGGGLVVETSSRKAGRAHEYVCSRRRYNGSCANALRMSVAEVNEALLNAIEEHALTPEAVEAVIALTERDDVRERKDVVAAEHADVDRRIRRLVAMIETDAGDVASLVARVRELEAKRDGLARELAHFEPIPRLPEAVIENRLAEWRRLLRQSTTQARAVLQRVLVGRVTFTPDGRGGYAFAAPTRYDRLFTGLVAPRPAYVPEGTTGWEHLRPEDTLDADYGRVLERAYAASASNNAKGLASLVMHSWNRIERWLRSLEPLLATRTNGSMRS